MTQRMGIEKIVSKLHDHDATPRLSTEFHETAFSIQIVSTRLCEGKHTLSLVTVKKQIFSAIHPPTKTKKVFFLRRHVFAHLLVTAQGLRAELLHCVVPGCLIRCKGGGPRYQRGRNSVTQPPRIKVLCRAIYNMDKAN